MKTNSFQTQDNRREYLLVYMVDINLDTLIATCKTANNRPMDVDLKVSSLGILVIPNAGEAWYIQRVSRNTWSLAYRARTQNQAIFDVDKLGRYALRTSEDFLLNGSPIQTGGSVCKLTDTSVTSLAILTIDSALQLSVSPGFYSVRAELYQGGTGSMDYTLRTSGGTIPTGVFSEPTLGSSPVAINGGSLTCVSNPGLSSVHGIIVVTVTTILSVYWAQSISSGSPLILKAGSFLVVTKTGGG